MFPSHFVSSPNTPLFPLSLDSLQFSITFRLCIANQCPVPYYALPVFILLPLMITNAKLPRLLLYPSPFLLTPGSSRSLRRRGGKEIFIFSNWYGHWSVSDSAAICKHWIGLGHDDQRASGSRGQWQFKGTEQSTDSLANAKTNPENVYGNQLLVTYSYGGQIDSGTGW